MRFLEFLRPKKQEPDSDLRERLALINAVLVAVAESQDPAHMDGCRCGQCANRRELVDDELVRLEAEALA